MVLWDLVPAQWRDQSFIAGGYAACPALASDCDLWVFVESSLTPLVDAREQVARHIHGLHLYLADEDETSTTEYEGVNVNIMKVGHVDLGKWIHVMVVDAPVNAVLCGFDVSTHQLALLPSGEVFLGQSWTAITEPPIKLIDTPQTDARMEKIRRRYTPEVAIAKS